MHVVLSITVFHHIGQVIPRGITITSPSHTLRMGPWVGWGCIRARYVASPSPRFFSPSGNLLPASSQPEEVGEQWGGAGFGGQLAWSESLEALPSWATLG